MRKLLGLTVVVILIALTGFVILNGDISLDSFNDLLDQENIEGREFQSGEDATQEQISNASSQLEGESWEYEETKTSDGFKQISFNEGEKSAEVTIDSDGRLIEKDMQAEELSDGSSMVVYNRSEAVSIATESILDRNWTLEGSTLLNGTYNLEFTETDYDAYVKVDGSTGKVIRKKITFRDYEE